MAESSDTGETLLREADVSAERNVSIARIAVAVVLFAAIELLTDKSDLMVIGVADQVRYGQLTLALLFLGGVTALLLVQTGRWRSWMAYATTTLDIGIVASNVWLNFRTSGFPGSLMILFPGSSAFLVVLVTSGLRLRPWLQAYALALMIGSMVFLTWWAGDVTSAQLGRMLGNAGAYLSVTPTTLRGLMFAAAGGILIVSALRGRRLLLRAVEETTRRVNLGRYLPAELAPVLATRRIDELKTGQRSTVGLLFVDIRNSTAMEEALEAGALARFIGAFRRRVSEAATVHDGIIDKFVGDGAFLVFGVIEQKRDDATRALACARDLLARIALWNEDRKTVGEAPVAVGIGVHYGEAFVGAIGDDARLEFTVLGDAVNVAARLEQATKDHRVGLLVSREALVAAGEEIAGWRALGAERLRGRSQPVAVYTPAGAAVSPVRPGERLAGRA